MTFDKLDRHSILFYGLFHIEIYLGKDEETGQIVTATLNWPKCDCIGGTNDRWERAAYHDVPDYTALKCKVCGVIVSVYYSENGVYWGRVAKVKI